MSAHKFLLSVLVASSLFFLVLAQAPTASSGGFENEVISSEGINTFRVRRSWSLNTATRTLVATGIRVKRVRHIFPFCCFKYIQFMS
jgi:hypothetical protein